MILQIAFYVLGLLLFLFLYWKRLKDDYVANQIFTSALIISVFFAFGIVISNLVLGGGWWFWASLAASLFGIAASINKFRMRSNEVGDAFFISILPAYILYLLVYFGQTKDFRGIVASLVVLFIFILYFVLEAHYKQFSWYKSGKIGFSSLMAIGILFLLRASVAFFIRDMVSFVGVYEVYLSSVFSLLAFGTLVYLARKL